jgi:DNA polymerase-3 subunit epsilon
MYLAFDVETTGLETNCNVLTAYFIILDADYNKIDTLDLKIKYPYYIIYPKALEINKIDILKHDKDINSVYTELAILKLNSFLEKNKTNTKYKIMGHNVQFDLNMLINNNILTKEYIDIYLDLSKYIDTLILARELKLKKIIPKNQSLSLSKLCYYYDLYNELENKFHNAEYDIKLTILLYKKLKYIESNNE